MNGIDDLRRTLDDRATGLVDDDVSARSAAVHRRVGVVRRRRRAGAAAAAVLAVASGAVVLADNGDAGPEPAERIVGVEVPDELTALGYTYEYSEGIEGENGRVEVRLKAADEPRLVSWATSGDDERVRVTEPLEDGTVVRESPDFMDWIYVPAGTEHTVRISAGSGQPGLAVYTLGDQRPDGITQDGVTFRKWVGSQRLIDADVGEPGEAELVVPATAEGQGLGFYYFCSGGPKDGRVDLYVGDGGSISNSGPCDDAVPVDGAQGQAGSLSSSPGEDVTMRLVVRDADGDVVDDPDLRIGLGVYSDRFDPVSIDGAPEHVEWGGHRWALDQLEFDRGSLGLRQHFLRAPADGGATLAVIRYDVRSATVDIGADADVRGEAGGASVTELLGPGERTGYRVVEGELSDEDRFQIAFYVLAD